MADHRVSTRAARLRVLIAAPLQADLAVAYALLDERGRVLAEADAVPAKWPDARRREAIVSADAVRTMSVRLPPIPAARLGAAVAFAVEERLATRLEEVIVAHGERDQEGGVVATVVSRALVASLAAPPMRFDRVVAEPALAPRGLGWHWCERPGAAFVSMPDGSALATSALSGPDLPAELAFALQRAGQQGDAPHAVVVERECSRDDLDRWQQQTGVPFEAGTPWQWFAPGRDGGVDLLATLRREATSAATGAKSSWWTAAAWLLAAFGLHVAAQLGTWAWYQFEAMQARRELAAIARSLGVGETGDLQRSIARMHEAARHRAGLQSGNDAFPTLARAAPALSTLAPGAMRSAHWAAGAWTFEFTPSSEATTQGLVSRWADQGLVALVANTPAGLRARVSLPAAAP